MPVSVSSHHLNFRYEEKDYMQNKTRATALGSLQLIDMKGCVGKSEPLNLIRFLLSHFNVNLKDSFQQILESFKTSDFLAMKTEFDFGEDDDYVKHVFGHCVYNLVATSDGKWMDDAQKYKSLSLNKLSPFIDT